MKQLCQQKLRSGFRLILLLSIMTGLLFSSGEGIQLLPYPPSQTSSNSQPLVDSKNKIPYQFSIHRIENYQGKREPKTRSEKPNHFWLKGNQLPEPVWFCRMLTLRQTGFGHDQLRTNSNLFVFAKGNRGPPFV